jgi:predicted RecB family nuclease
VQKYRVDDFAAYFRLIRNRLEATSLQDHALLAAENYPEPVDHCEICRWQNVCDTKRRADDHLSLVSGMRRLQSHELEVAGIHTLAQFGELSLPQYVLSFRIGRRHVYLYDVVFDGQTVVNGSPDPEFDLALALLARGLTGKVTVLDGGKVRTILDIEKAAKLRTTEPAARRSSFVPYC